MPNLKGVEELLNFEQVAIWIAEKEVVDVIVVIGGRRLVQSNVPLRELLMPFVDIGGDDRKDCRR